MIGTLTLAIRHRIVPTSVATPPQESIRTYHSAKHLPWFIMQPSFWKSGDALDELLNEGRNRSRHGGPQIVRRLRPGSCGFALIDLTTKRAFSCNDQFTPGECMLTPVQTAFKASMENQLAMAQANMLEEITSIDSKTDKERTIPACKFIREAELFVEKYDKWIDAKIFNQVESLKQKNLGKKSLSEIQKDYATRVLFFTMRSSICQVKSIPFKTYEENPAFILQRANDWLQENGWTLQIKELPALAKH